MGDALTAEQAETKLGSIETWAADEQSSVAIVRKG
jgi:hypothetical protein